MRLEIYYQSNGIFLNQHKYVHDLISLAVLEDNSLVSTPMDVNVKYKKGEGIFLNDPTFYRHLVESLIYLTTTYSDISYAVH